MDPRKGADVLPVCRPERIKQAGPLQPQPHSAGAVRVLGKPYAHWLWEQNHYVSRSRVGTTGSSKRAMLRAAVLRSTLLLPAFAHSSPHTDSPQFSQFSRLPPPGAPVHYKASITMPYYRVIETKV